MDPRKPKRDNDMRHMTYESPYFAAGRLKTILEQPLVPSGKKSGCRISCKLGHDPGGALYAMREYGLSDREIATYYAITPSTVRRLTRLFNIPARL